jgi:hypothetical protein
MKEISISRKNDLEIAFKLEVSSVFVSQRQC